MCPIMIRMSQQEEEAISKYAGTEARETRKMLWLEAVVVRDCDNN